MNFRTLLLFILNCRIRQAKQNKQKTKTNANIYCYTYFIKQTNKLILKTLSHLTFHSLLGSFVKCQ